MGRRLQVDRAIFMTVVGQMLRVLTGPLAILALGKCLSENELGYYYTFQPLLGLSVFLELGFSQNIVQFTAHEASRLALDPSGSLSGDAQALSRVRSLARKSCGYFALAAGIFLIVVGCLGVLFFHEGKPSEVEWFGPWWLAVAATAMVFVLTPFWGILEGFNRIAEIAHSRLIGTFLTFVALVVGLLLGWKLWALAFSSLVNVLWGGWYLWSRWRGFWKAVLQKDTGPSVSWRKEIWPFQWRIAISYVSGYFISSILSPVVFKLCGKVEAGQLGMTTQLLRTITGFSGAWVTTKTASICFLIAKQEWTLVDRLWKQATKVALGLSFFGLGCFFGAQLLALNYWPVLAQRLVSWPATLVLILGVFSAQAITCLAIFLRAHKSEPYMGLSVLAGIIGGTSIPLLTYNWGVYGAAWGFSLSSLVLLPPAWWIYRAKREEYRAEQLDPSSILVPAK